MMRFAAILMGWLLALGCARADEGIDWLQKMNLASRQLSFSGVFVYQTQGRTETSRIFRLIDGSGEHERLETLDGTPREVVRHNEQVQCFLPADRILVLDRAVLARQPGRLVSKAAALAEYYLVRAGGHARVAGREAQMVTLEPRDDMRYGHQLWIDVATGLLLKSRMLSGPGGTIEQFAFTEINPVTTIDHSQLKPRSTRTAGWRVVNAAGEDLRPEDAPWEFRKLPAGFKPVSLLKRTMRKGGDAAIHASFSDGLANVSVFIERPSGATQGATPPAGAIGSYRRILGEHQVTVLGEVPAAALKRIADGVEHRK